MRRNSGGLAEKGNPPLCRGTADYANTSCAPTSAPNLVLRVAPPYSRRQFKDAEETYYGNDHDRGPAARAKACIRPVAHYRCGSYVLAAGTVSGGRGQGPVQGRGNRNVDDARQDRAGRQDTAARAR